MKKYILPILFMLISCGENIREEIVKRYSDGTKKLVVRYIGKGSNEIVIGRTEYYKNGNIRKNESISGENKKVVEFYSSNGDTNKVSEYNSGKLITMRAYYENGQLTAIYGLEGAINKKYDVDGNIIYDGKTIYLTKRLVEHYWSGEGRAFASYVPIDKNNRLISYNSYFEPNLREWHPNFENNINEFHQKYKKTILATEFLKMDNQYFLNQNFNDYFISIKYHSINQKTGYKKEILITEKDLNKFIEYCFSNYTEFYQNLF